MMASNRDNAPDAKRCKLDDAALDVKSSSTTSISLNRPVSPPTSRRKTPKQTAASLLAPTPTWGFDDVAKQTLPPSVSQAPPQHGQGIQHVSRSKTLKDARDDAVAGINIKRIASPFQLTKIRDLAPYQNVDTVELKNILGNPMIKECWNFNFLFDLDFVMRQFDEDVKSLVKVKIVHGFWKRDDERRINLMETAERYSNIELINAYLPDPFGTHHSKMLVLFRHDDCAQVIIHTANMISKDWMNMTQAVWRSPLLPLSVKAGSTMGSHAIGSGERFRNDLIRYLGSYEKRMRRLIEQLCLYDFSGIRAAFLGSTPSRQLGSTPHAALQTSFGWLGLQEILSELPVTDSGVSQKPSHIVLQVSSIATLGATPTWFSHFQSVLSRSRTPQQHATPSKPRFNVIFPSSEEIRTSLDGYESGGSIHVKVQSTQQQKQLQYLRPLLSYWRRPSLLAAAASTESIMEAHRGPAAPHIKTYIRFGDDTHKNIDWALLTSANLSKQAWGDVANKQGEIRIQSYETGVLVWPGLFAEPGDEAEVTMVPVFGKDTPAMEDIPATYAQHIPESEAEPWAEEAETKDRNPANSDEETADENEDAHQSGPKQDKGKGKALLAHSSKQYIAVGLRMPYDLPLCSYSPTDVPWCATQPYTEPDWKGRTWGGF